LPLVAFVRRNNDRCSAAACSPPASPSPPRRRRGAEVAGPGRCRSGIDHALVESRLGPSLQTAFSADTGIAVKLVAGPALAVLEATKEGELDAALTNAPAAEAALDKQTLVHDRRAIAAGDFLIVGPAPARPRQGGPGGQPQRGRGADKIREAAGAAPDSLVFLSAGDGSGPMSPSRRCACRRHRPGGALVRERRRLGRLRRQGEGARRFAVVERGAWSVAGGGLAGARRRRPAARRVGARDALVPRHPSGGKIFIAWIGGGRGHAVVASHRGYRRPA
jgi:tungstate transport system substrate-binding protein